MLFPPPEKLLGDFLRFEPHTREGQWKAATHVADLVRQHNLGTAKILEYPQYPDGSGESYPLVKVIAEFGPVAPHETRNLMTWLGHVDTVDPVGEQIGADTLTIENHDSTPSRTTGTGRGSLDMWGGNIAYLCALAILKQSGNVHAAIQLILSSREESGSEVLYQAIRNGDIEQAPVGATTEILVGDNGRTAPLYIGRTGRIGIDAVFRGEAPHSGAVDRNPQVIDLIAHRYLARALDEILDDKRGFRVENTYPGDTSELLPTTSRAIPGSIHGKPKGLSVVRDITQHFDIFPSDPQLAPERIITRFNEYLLQNIPDYGFELKLESRRGVPFIEPWLTPPDHPLVAAAHTYAKEVQGSDVEIVAASGVAEEAMLFHRLGTKMVGWAPVGKGAHEESEHVQIESIYERAAWLAMLAQHDGDLS